MRVVVAVGGNALLERGEVPLAKTQEKNVAVMVKALAPLARDHDLVITHGNGPQVGLLANESSADPNLPSPYPLDVLVAQTQGMIGYFLLQEFGNALPGQQVACLICQTKVAAEVRCRIDGPQGRSGLPFRGGDRQAGDDRSA
jgi:carbamate kinase